MLWGRANQYFSIKGPQRASQTCLLLYLSEAGGQQQSCCYRCDYVTEPQITSNQRGLITFMYGQRKSRAVRPACTSVTLHTKFEPNFFSFNSFIGGGGRDSWLQSNIILKLFELNWHLRQHIFVPAACHGREQQLAWWGIHNVVKIWTCALSSSPKKLWCLITV